MNKLIPILLMLLVSVAAISAEDNEDKEKDLFSSTTFSGLSFRSIGPALTSGRIGDFAAFHTPDPAASPTIHNPTRSHCVSQRPGLDGDSHRCAERFEHNRSSRRGFLLCLVRCRWNRRSGTSRSSGICSIQLGKGGCGDAGRCRHRDHRPGTHLLRQHVHDRSELVMHIQADSWPHRSKPRTRVT